MNMNATRSVCPGPILTNGILMFDCRRNIDYGRQKCACRCGCVQVAQQCIFKTYAIPNKMRMKFIDREMHMRIWKTKNTHTHKLMVIFLIFENITHVRDDFAVIYKSI